MKKKIIIFLLFIICNFIKCTQITLTNPVLKIVDGITGLMDGTKIHKIITIGRILNTFVYGKLLDPETKNRGAEHKLGEKLYTLSELVKIEEEFEKKYGPIQKPESQKFDQSAYRDRADELPIDQPVDNPIEQVETNILNPDNSINTETTETDIEQAKKDNLELRSLPTSTTHSIALTGLSKEDREKYEQEKKNIIQALDDLKEKFLEQTTDFLKDARGSKQHMYKLIQEWAEKSKRTDSLLLGWSSEDEGASFRRRVTSIKKLHVFCLDLIDFLKVLVHSCPKALKAFIKENPSYNFSGRKADH